MALPENLNLNNPAEVEQERPVRDRHAEDPYDEFSIGHDGGISTVVTKIQDTEGELWVGNVARGGCVIAGKGLCKLACQRPERDNEDRLCADKNLLTALEEVTYHPETVLMVGVTDDKVGFFDEIELTDANRNSVGIYEVKGYNAFAARVNEENDAMQVRSLGSRMADCAHVGFQFRDKDGEQVVGFIHGTRTNLPGEAARTFERDGKKVGFMEHALGKMLDHYEVMDPGSVAVRVSAAIAAENWPKTFTDEAAMEKHLPGWFQEGRLKNPQNPDWEPGDYVDPTHVWEADYRGKVLHDLTEAMRNLGMNVDLQLEADDLIDPAAPGSLHSSHTLSNTDRDLYLVGIDIGEYRM